MRRAESISSCTTHCIQAELAGLEGPLLCSRMSGQTMRQAVALP